MEAAEKSNLIDALAKFLANERPRPAISWALEWAVIRRAGNLEPGMPVDEMRTTLRRAFGLPVNSYDVNLAPMSLVVEAVIVQQEGKPLGKGYYEYRLACGHATSGKYGEERKSWARCQMCRRQQEQLRERSLFVAPRKSIYDLIAEKEEQDRAENGTLDYEI